MYLRIRTLSRKTSTNRNGARPLHIHSYFGGYYNLTTPESCRHMVLMSSQTIVFRIHTSESHVLITSTVSVCKSYACRLLHYVWFKHIKSCFFFFMVVENTSLISNQASYVTMFLGYVKRKRRENWRK